MVDFATGLVALGAPKPRPVEAAAFFLPLFFLAKSGLACRRSERDAERTGAVVKPSQQLSCRMTIVAASNVSGSLGMLIDGTFPPEGKQLESDVVKDVPC